MYVMPGFIDLHVHAGGAPKNADAEYAYKLWLAHGVTTVRGVPLAGNALDGAARRSAARATRSSRRASSTTSVPAAAGTRRLGRHAREGARVGPAGRDANGVDGLKLGAERPDMMAALLDEAKKLGLGIDRAPAADRRRADERDRGRAPRPRHRHAFLRTLRVAAQGLRRPAVSGRPELQRRAGSLRPGGAAVGQDLSARQPRVEGVSRGAPEARHARSIRR